LFKPSFFLLCYFFFQAEDGIRDRNVTGVQTCALPILIICVPPGKVEDYAHAVGSVAKLAANAGVARLIFSSATSIYGGVGNKTRSEERRVGKECRKRREAER